MRDAAHVSLRRTAFTLVELLVVIGIIAVLLSIILPVVSRVRHSARLVNCQANVRQLVQASISYASDNDGILPLPNLQSQDGPNTPGWLYKDIPLATNPAQVETGVLWKYLKVRDVYHCPLDPGPWGRGVTEAFTSYLMNPSVMNPALANPKPNTIPSSYALRRMNPQAILFLEADQSPPPPPRGPSDPPPPPVKPQAWLDGAAQLDKDSAVRHGAVGACIGCFDGHVEMILSTEYASQQTLYQMNPPQGRLYCLSP
ncbi:MAG: N-terminal cleavage protein [Phycisphaerales bacterium]|nr:N-terminal cleavage protein [Phycisphaerales bacterium]